MNSNSSTAHSARIGLIAIAASCVAGALTIPLVKSLRHQFSAEDLLLVRSLFSGLLAFAIVGRRVWYSDWRLKLSGLIIGLSSISFYRAVQVWDVNPVMVILASAPIVNVVLAYIEGKHVGRIALSSFFLLFLGIVIALDPWRHEINLSGLGWAIISAIASGAGFELWGRCKSEARISEKVFWLALALTLVTVAIIVGTQKPIHFGKYIDHRWLGSLTVFGVLGGIVYINCSIVPFSKVGKINTAVASVLMQVLTPCTIIGCYFLLGERQSFVQWVGVAVALSGAAILSVWTSRQAATDQ